MGFLGYRRADGRVGVRNHVVVMSSVSCANGVVAGIGRELPQVKTVTHTEGCGRGPKDVEITLRTLANVASHPNVGACLIVGLGCEVIKNRFVHDKSGAGERVQLLGIQETGGTPKTIAKGVEIARKMLEDVAKQQREEFGYEHLTVAMDCGGSDSMSGLTANPTVGKFADWLVTQGGSVILSEVTEFLGTENIVGARCASEEVRTKLLDLLGEHKQLVKKELGAFANFVIAPGNSEGGLSSIQEKSLGCIEKGGSTDIQAVVDYAERVTQRGLNIMNTPGSDIFSITGKIAGGAQIVLFTTGRGSPAGSPIAPVVKIASNSKLFEWMPDDMDFDAGRVMRGMTLDAAGAELVELVKEVANGRPTAPEKTKTELFSIHTVGPAF
jgi:altronate dehydratase large subunit